MVDLISDRVKPILKWAGGKSQLLNALSEYIPDSFNQYFEPFFGGGALFFALKPKNSLISDSNPELINMYQQVADNVDEVIEVLKDYQYSKEFYYKIRSLDWANLPPIEAAARTIYLNKTCFNGLYRVNKKGQFNVPFGNYKNPKICDEDNLKKASRLLGQATIVCADYKKILDSYVKKGDFVFLDPPYVPISKNADFKRYTKEQFYLSDHEELSIYVRKLVELGCKVVVTNSDCEQVRNLFSEYKIISVDTKRYISSKGSSRTGKDVIIVPE